MREEGYIRNRIWDGGRGYESRLGGWLRMMMKKKRENMAVLFGDH